MRLKNNIEEGIKILERMIKIEKECLHYDVSRDELQAIKNILADREINKVKANKYDALVEKMKEKIEEIRKYEEIAREQIGVKIVIADSDSLNFGRKQAHEKDIEVIQELIPKEE